MQVYKINESGFYIFETYFIEESNEFEISEPCNTSEGNTFYKPKWDGEKWTEGATQDEIDEINKIDICPTKTVEERLEEAEQRLAEKDQENKMLKAQVEANASSYEFLESCIMEMAEKVYA